MTIAKLIFPLFAMLLAGCPPPALYRIERDVQMAFATDSCLRNAALATTGVYGVVVGNKDFLENSGSPYRKLLIESEHGIESIFIDRNDAGEVVSLAAVAWRRYEESDSFALERQQLTESVLANIEKQCLKDERT